MTQEQEKDFSVEGTIVDPVTARAFEGEVFVSKGLIEEVVERSVQTSGVLILPGLIDSHVHIESSLLVPSEFARLAVCHGTVGTVSDPHEIANVLGLEGVEYMFDNASLSPFKFAFGAPSCVPATMFETSGATLGSEKVSSLLEDERIYYLSEVMNYPGVISRDTELMKKIEAAKNFGKPIDGHAPGVIGRDLDQYISAGITTDHESFRLEEGREKIEKGMYLLIREGSAARNFDALQPLISEFPDRIMFCSDDKHPDQLVRGHINELISRGLECGHDIITLTRASTLNPVRHYSLNCGLLQRGDPADIATFDPKRNMKSLGTWIAGVQVSRDGKSLLQSSRVEVVNRFKSKLISSQDISVRSDSGSEFIRIILALNNQIVTERETLRPTVMGSEVVADPVRDIAKIVVVNRYIDSPLSIAFVRGFGLKSGALASSVAHDSHNVVAVGVDDDSIVDAVNSVMKASGGLSVSSAGVTDLLPLPVAGLMSDKDPWTVASAYTKIDRRSKVELGSSLDAPFMTLSFMALLVIPSLKLSDKGLFDGDLFEFTQLFCDQ